MPKKYKTKRDKLLPSTNDERDGIIESAKEKKTKKSIKLIKEFNYSMNITGEEITRKPASIDEVNKNKHWTELSIRFPVHILDDIKKYIDYQLSGTFGDSFETLKVEDAVRLLTVRALNHWKKEREAIERVIALSKRQEEKPPVESEVSSEDKEKSVSEENNIISLNVTSFKK